MNAKRITACFRLLLVSVFVLVSVSDSAVKKVKSTVTAATIYSDRALITRAGQEELPTGQHSLVFTDLPPTLLDESLRVTGESDGKAKIVDVKVETVFLDTIPEDRIRQLQDQLKRLRTQQQILTDQQNVIRTQKSLIDSLRIHYPRELRAGVSGQKSPFEDWERMLAFVEKNLTSINNRILETNEMLQDVKSKIEAIEREIQQTRGYSRKSQKQVIVGVEVSHSGSVKLQVSYIVFAASWTPMYEARVSSDPPSLQLQYLGIVRQSTNEDWSGIELTLSTAQPAAGGSPAQLRPWFVDVARPMAAPGRSTARVRSQVERLGQGNILQGTIRDRDSGEPLIGANVLIDGTPLGTSTDANGSFVLRNVPPGVHRVTASYIGYGSYTVPNVRTGSNVTAWIDFELAPTAVQVQALAISAERVEKPAVARETVAYETAQVQSQLTSAIFRIPSKADIPSDDNPHKVGIALESLQVDFEYTAIPKLAAFAYLRATAKNTTEYTFLAGPMDVFFDNSFVASTSIGAILPQEVFSAHLGVDEGIRIERKLLNRFTEYTGTFTKKTKVTYDVLTTVQNLKKSNVTITVQDQIPISRNENITVEQIMPEAKMSPPDESGMLTWKLQLSPAEKKEIRLKFSIEHPREMIISGFE